MESLKIGYFSGHFHFSPSALFKVEFVQVLAWKSVLVISSVKIELVLEHLASLSVSSERSCRDFYVRPLLALEVEFSQIVVIAVRLAPKM